MELTLHGYWRSSSSYRVRIALELKGLAYTYAAVHLLEGGGQQFNEDYRAKNPSAQVPTLVVSGENGRSCSRSAGAGAGGPAELGPEVPAQAGAGATDTAGGPTGASILGAGRPLVGTSGDGEPLVIAQSVAILEFLDETFPAPALLPSSARERARVRQLVEVINSGIQPIANLSVLKYLGRAMQQDESARNAWTRHWIAGGFEALEKLLEQSAGRFAFGDEVTLADCFIVPQVYNANRFQVDLSPYPTLRRVSAEAEALPAFLRARPEVQVDAPVQT